MAELEQPSSGRRCVQCGGELPAQAPPGLCPKCLLQAALGTQTAAEPGAPPLPEAKRRGLPQPGEQFGHYTIVRLLGEGGMGAVFDAQDLESGRRVALKVLSHTLDSPEARERFFREGRLAASINHPNSVYVFGTEEIGGTPVIAMELVAGGTLQERVGAQGPLSVGEAVDCALQMIAGLEAAQRIGILHRDVKPSNCFRDADGTVKIGDFGLSISTAVRTEPSLTATGLFLGTPAFCSPEQLRGDELNARSDLYSVGATLFYLLTGRTPFEGRNPVQLLATVLEQRAPSPRQIIPTIPRAVAKAVQRCLEKQPGERFKSYDELRQVLAPYSSSAPTPATLGLRCLAGCLDFLFIGVFGFVTQMLVWGSLTGFLNAAAQRSPRALVTMLLGMTGALMYYTLLDGLRGATLGKALCRLRVVGPERNPPGIPKAFLRTLIYAVLPVLPYWIAAGFDPLAYMQGNGTRIQYLVIFTCYPILALLFSTARRRNGFAAVHDLLTNTRVILVKTVHAARPGLKVGDEPAPSSVESRPMIGPYHVLETLGTSTAGEWLLAFDSRLLRKVWIHSVTPGAPPIAPHQRSLGRVGRLRWIAGRRSPEENWDAFEAVSGQPLVRLSSEPQPWTLVRGWLLDLAGEISAATKDGTLPVVLALDRVWIRNDGCAKLLDFPAPGLAAGEWETASGTPPAADRHAEARSYLNDVARAALEGRGLAGTGAPTRVVPLPLHVRAFLEKLATLASPEAIVAALTPLMHRTAVVSRWRRLGVVAACAAFPALAALGMMFSFRVLNDLQRSQPGVFQLSQILQQRTVMRSSWVKNPSGPEDRLVAIYIASHYQATVTNANTWSNLFTLSLITPENRRFAEQSVADHPNPTEQETQEAEAALEPYVRAFAASAISERALVDVTSFAGKLKQPADAVSLALKDRLSTTTRAALANYQQGSNQLWLRLTLAQDLNAIIRGQSIYDAERFAGVSLRLETQNLLTQNPQGDDLRRLNRLLLEDAYPREISRDHVEINPLGFAQAKWFPLLVFGVSLLVYVAIPAVILALLFRGGPMLLMFGIAIVRPDGTRTTRLRTLWRSLIAWSPVLVAPVLVPALTAVVGVFPAAVSLASLVIVLTTVSLALRHRGLPDRLAGTWMVPR